MRIEKAICLGVPIKVDFDTVETRNIKTVGFAGWVVKKLAWVPCKLGIHSAGDIHFYYDSYFGAVWAWLRGKEIEC